MTFVAVNDITPLDQYTATASQTDFVFSYVIYATSDILVYVNDVLKTITTDYTVVNSDDSAITAADLADGLEGGKVVFNSGLDVDDAVSLSRDIPVSRTVGYTTSGAFTADAINLDGNKFTAMLQELERDKDRTLRQSASDTASGPMELPALSLRASKYLGFDASGNPAALDGASISGTSVTPYMATLLDDATAAIARATLAAQEDVVTTRGDVIRGSSAGIAERLALGTSGQFLKSDGTDIAWASEPITTRGDIMRGSSTGVPERLALGAAGTALVSDGTDAAWGKVFPRGHLAGCVMSLDTDTDHDVNVTSGECRSDADDGNITLSSEITKKIDVDWVAGDDAGGFPSGLTLSADTTYHFFIIAKTDGTTDAGWDTSLTAANLLTDATGYTLYRRVGSNITDASSNILDFDQTGDYFEYRNDITDLSDTTPANTKTNVTVSTPAGISVTGVFTMIAQTSATSGTNWFGSDMSDAAPSSAAARAFNISSAEHQNNDFVVRSTNSTISYRTADTTQAVFVLLTRGYYDDRGRSE